MYLQSGYREQPTNGPNRPLLLTSVPSWHSGQTSPVPSWGGGSSPGTGRVSLCSG